MWTRYWTTVNSATNRMSLGTTRGPCEQDIELLWIRRLTSWVLARQGPMWTSYWTTVNSATNRVSLGTTRGRCEQDIELRMWDSFSGDHECSTLVKWPILARRKPTDVSENTSSGTKLEASGELAWKQVPNRDGGDMLFRKIHLVSTHYNTSKKRVSVSVIYVRVWLWREILWIAWWHWVQQRVCLFLGVNLIWNSSYFASSCVVIFCFASSVLLINPVLL
jgi:hypothetical protein